MRLDLNFKSLTKEDYESMHKIVYDPKSVKSKNKRKNSIVIKGGGYFEDVCEILTTEHENPNRFQLALNDHYMHRIYDVVSTNDPNIRDNQPGYAGFKTNILGRNGNVIGKFKIQAVETQALRKVIIGAYDLNDNNNCHISFFRNSFMHVTFIIDGVSYHLYYKLQPNNDDNWGFIIEAINTIERILFLNDIPLINANINKNGKHIWTDDWKNILFNLPHNIAHRNKDFIRRELDLLKRGVNAIMALDFMSLVPIVRPVALMTKRKRQLSNSPPRDIEAVRRKSPPRSLESRSSREARAAVDEPVVNKPPKKSLLERLGKK